MVSVDPVDILLVEDNPHDVELTLRALERHHLGVCAVEDFHNRKSNEFPGAVHE